MSQGQPRKPRASDRVVVDRGTCELVASILASRAVPREREEILLPLAPERLGNFYLGLVAICHQTQTLHGRVAGVPTRGWDYLQAKWLEAAERDAQLLTPESWASLSAETVRRVFADRDVGNTLTDVEGRAFLLNDLGGGMLQRGWGTLGDLYELSGKRVASLTGFMPGVV